MATELSKDVLDQALIVSGHHSIDWGVYTKDMIGQLDAAQRRCLGLMEAIDYDCFSYEGSACINFGTNTLEDVEQYLIQHRKTVYSLPSPSSLLGLLGGKFDFLTAGVK